MAFNVIDVATPAGSSKKKFIDDYIKEFKVQVRDNLSAISGYPHNAVAKTAIWTNATRPDSNLVDGLVGFNTTLGCDEYYDLATTTWMPKWSTVVIAAIQSMIDTAVAASGVPVGLIAIWSGTAIDVPTNWHLCDGTSGTVDLRDKFVICAGSSYAVGASGGAATHLLTVAEMPAHNHDLRDGSGGDRTGTIKTNNLSGQDEVTTWYNSTELMKNTGGGAAHNNMPPYYSRCYIQKIA